VTRRRPVVVLAALCLALQGLLHAWCMPAMGQAGAIPVCTPDGVKLLPAQPGETPAAPHPDCPACQAGHCSAAFVPPARIAVAAPLAMPSAAAVVRRVAAAAARVAALPPARGPPSVG